MFSALYYLFTLVHTTILCILSALALLFTYPFQKSRRIVHELSRYMTWLFFLIPGIRRPVKGMENIDKKKSYVIVMNHNSGLDILAAYKIPLNFRKRSLRLRSSVLCCLCMEIFLSNAVMLRQLWQRLFVMVSCG